MSIHLDQRPFGESTLVSSEKTRPSFVLAEDNSLMSTRLQQLLAGDCELLAAVVDGSALVRAVRQHRPDVIVTDIDMPEMTGLEAARQILAEQPQARIVFVTALDEPEIVRAAMTLGARGFVTKRDAGRELILAIKSTLAGKIYISNTSWRQFDQALRLTQNCNEEQ